MTLKGGEEKAGWLETSGPEVMCSLGFLVVSDIPDLELTKLATQKDQWRQTKQSKPAL